MNPCEGFTLVVDFELPLPQKGVAKSNIKLKDVLRTNGIRWTAKYRSAIRIPKVDFLWYLQLISFVEKGVQLLNAVT